MTYVYGLIAALLFGAGFYFGHMRGQTQMAEQAASQAQAVAARVLQDKAHQESETERLNNVVKAYESGSLDPVIPAAVPGVATRLYNYSIRSCPVSRAPAAASGVVPAVRIPASDPELERLSQAAFDAAGRDATRLDLCRAEWPR